MCTPWTRLYDKRTVGQVTVWLPWIIFQATFPLQLSSALNVPTAPPVDKLRRIAEMFEQHLGRELTPEERKYLGFSVTVESVDDVELQGEKRRNEGQEEDGEVKAEKSGLEGMDQSKFNVQRSAG